MFSESLSRTSLFQGLNSEQVSAVLDCLNCRPKKYAKGQIILRAGDRAEAMGLVLTGSVNIENNDAWGNRSILDNIGPGEIFAETYSCLPEEPMLVDVAAAESTQLLLLSASKVLFPCDSACPHHMALIRNLLTLTARKNLSLSRRILYTSSKSIRGKLLSYLSAQASLQQSNRFSIPFNRQQLADFLGVDRSALCTELGKMRRENLIECEKNRFVLRRIDGTQS